MGFQNAFISAKTKKVVRISNSFGYLYLAATRHDRTARGNQHTKNTTTFDTASFSRLLSLSLCWSASVFLSSSFFSFFFTTGLFSISLEADASVDVVVVGFISIEVNSSRFCFFFFFSCFDSVLPSQPASFSAISFPLEMTEK